MVKLVLMADAPSTFHLDAEGEFKDQGFVLEKLTLLASGKGASLSVEASADPVVIPAKLLKKDGDDYRLVTRSELAELGEEEWSALRERVRRRLAEPVKITFATADDSFFGLRASGGAVIEASCLLPPALLDGIDAIKLDDPILTLLARGQLTFAYALKGYKALKLNGALNVKLVVRRRTLANIANAVMAAIDFDIPEFSGFDLKLHEIPMPDFSFDGLGLDLAEGWAPSLFDIALPAFGGGLKFVFTEPPKFAIKIVDGDMRIDTTQAGKGEVQYKNSTGVFEKMLGVSDVALTLAKAALEFKAVIEPIKSSYEVEPPDIDNKWLPVVLRVQKLKVTTEIAPADLAKWPSVTITYEFSGLKIVSRKTHPTEPELFVTLDLTVETKSTEGQLTTEVKKLKVVEPYPIDLIVEGAGQMARAVGELIRLVGPIALPDVGSPDVGPLGRLLSHLGRMLAKAIAWLAQQAGDAAGMLAGLLESVAKAIGSLLETLAKAGSGLFSHVVIELRLDPKTYHLRQIVLQPAGQKPQEIDLDMSAMGFDFVVSAKLEPSLVIDFGPEQWFGLVVKPDPDSSIMLATDLWLSKETGPSQPVGMVEGTKPVPTDPRKRAATRLIVIKATPGKSGPSGRAQDLVIVALQRGRLRLFQKIESAVDRSKPTEIQLGAGLTVSSLCQSGRLIDATIGAGDEHDLVISYEANIDELRQRALALMPKADTSKAPTEGGGLLDELKQKIEITGFTTKLVGRSIEIAFAVRVHLEKTFAPETKLVVSVDLKDLSVKLSGGDRIAIKGKGEKTYTPFGMELLVKPNDKVAKDAEYDQFYLDLSHGGESMGLGGQAVAELSYGSVSSSGKGLQFTVPKFQIGRGGIDLEAHIKPDPVILGGVDVPFKFDSGHIAISGSRFSGGSLTGKGQLPQSLIGEANATIALTLAGRDNGDVVVEAATARIDKSGDPIRCTSTRFDLTITELGFDFVREGGYHFFFLVTGSASFNPGKGEFTSGLLKHFGGVEIKLDKAPLAADPRVLMRAISFKVKVDPVKTIKAFDIFSFELRSFGYHPASPAFDGDPAISIGGQMKFMKSGDKNSFRMDFHDLWCSFGNGAPRFRCDGLTVGLSLGGVKVEGTAITVDGNLPSLYRPDVLPANITAHGFLASGKIEFPGWSPMTAAMGFLELRKKGDPTSSPRHAFFIYGQLEKQTEPIDTPVGRIYLREYGFGFGYRYTLAGIAQAETAKSPNELIKILDEVSKYQGSLDRFEAWEPTYDNADLTFALRGMFSMAAASERGSYNADKEKDIPNPLLLDIVAALRTDLTFLINVRAWIAVNYNDWTTAAPGDAWRTNPTMRGYLYFSVPRKEFLGRFVANRAGYIGNHPKLPSQLVDAIRGTDFSATLYIRPGLFHFELGWPYELGVELGKPGDVFYMKINGGMIHRMEDFSVLFGMAFRAVGAVHLQGGFGSDSFGAAAVAHADFAIEARILAFLSLRSPGESMYYGELRIDVTVRVSVEVWLSFKVFGHRISLSAGFSMDLAVSIALEAVLSAAQGLGGRAYASVGIRAFGRSASIGIGFSFNNGLLADARVRVARFAAMGLSAPVPDRTQDGNRIETNPPPQPPRSEVAAIGDQAVDTDLGNTPVVTGAADDKLSLYGRPIVETEFWAMLFPTVAPVGKSGDWFVMQIVPRDHTLIEGDKDGMAPKPWRDAPASFYASPRPVADGVAHKVSDISGALRDDATVFAAKWEDCEKAVIIAPVPGNTWFPVNLTAVVQEADPVRGSDAADIRTLLAGMFLEFEGDEKAHLEFGEPRPRNIVAGMDTLQDDREGSARQLARSGRTRANLDRLARREAEIEESRSAVLAAVVDSAAKLAVQGTASGVWPKRHPEIDARDFGLTFILNREAVTQLFDGDGELTPPLARFEVYKSDAPGKGSVMLFNPPRRMFREAQPSFAPTHVIEPQGIKLDWDLEPAWGNSLGAYHDPEFHLKHYRIVRTIDGIDGRTYRAEFVVKAGAPIAMAADGDQVQTLFMRPPFQFIDDLRKQGSQWNERGEADIPEAIRDGLLGQGNRKKWIDAGGPLRMADIRISYEIVAVDIAGTSDFGRPYFVDGFAEIAKPRPPSPREVSLQLEYPRMPSFPDHPAPPKLHFLARPALLTESGQTTASWPEKGEQFQLRIWSEPACATGSYGTDAVDAAGRRLDERAINRLNGAGVTDFVLVVKDPLDKGDFAAAQLITEWVPEGARPADHAPRLHAVEVRRVSGATLAVAGMDDIANALGARLEAKNIGLSHRMFVRKLERPSSGALPSLSELDLAVHGEWRTVSANIVVKEDKETRISAIVEEFEQPVDITFRALTRQDLVHGESGRLHVIQPDARADLALLLDATNNPDIDPFKTVRDLARRTASRLTWKARPSELQYRQGEKGSGSAPNLHRWVGGFDLHVIDADGVPKGAALVPLARHLGHVGLLPKSLAGLEIDGFGDFGKIESAYPSDTLRQQNAPGGAGANGIRQAAWFSTADSTAMFPQPAIRRSLMPDPDEDLLAALFAGGAPAVIRVSIPAWFAKNADPLAAWNIARAEHAQGHLPAFPGLDSDFAKAVADGTPIKAAHFAFTPGKGKITVALVRDLLQSICLLPAASDANVQEEAALQRRLDDPRHLAAIEVKVEALYCADLAAPSPVLVLTAHQESLVDLAPPLHPVLADTLALLAYDPRPGGGDAAGQVYRRYSLVADAVPDTNARTFADWLDEAPPERDPHGWGALRTLGLAAGFRLYDSEEGDYVRGKELLTAVNRQMTRALNRYRDPDDKGIGRRFNGQPFADLLTRPWGNSKLFWFDGGYRNPNKAERDWLIANEMMAVVQIALRPAPDRLAVTDSRLVHYFQLKIVDQQTFDEIADWTIGLVDPAAAFRFDVVSTLESIVGHHPQRLGAGSPCVVRALSTDKPIAIVRAVRIGPITGTAEKAATPALKLDRIDPHTNMPVGVGFELTEIELALLHQKDGGGATPGDPAFGKFSALAGEDWADALFQPAHVIDTISYAVSPVPAYQALSFYAGRRFARLVVKQGAAVIEDGATVEASDARQSRAEFAGALARFWLRFIEHCAPAQAAETVHFSLGTVADPGQWRCVPDEQGNVSVVIPEMGRRGSRRKYAVRPVGRYESWVKAAASRVDPAFEKPPSLEGALLDKADELQFFDLTLPRTEPLEKAVILSALRHAAPQADGSGRLELVIAHGLDMVLGQSNQRNEALLAPLDISVGYWRHFVHRDWLRALQALAAASGSGAVFDALAPFGHIEPDVPANALPVLDADTAASRLVELRQRVPDAWLGATVVTAVPPPYFFRVHALVHSAAGIVVSEQSAATFEEGASTLCFADGAGGYAARTAAAAPFYQVMREGDNEDLMLMLDLPAVRFIDCMHAEEAKMWFGAAGEHWDKIRPVAHLPEPGVSYRISVETALATGSGDGLVYEPLARQTEVDLLPAPFKEAKPGVKHQGLYLARRSGARLRLTRNGAEPEPIRVDPVPATKDALEWRIRIGLYVDALALPPARVATLPAWSAEMEKALAQLPASTLLARAIDGLRVVTLVKATIIDGWEGAFANVLDALRSKDKAGIELAPEAVAALAAWKDQPKNIGARLRLAVPIDLLAQAVPALTALCGHEPDIDWGSGIDQVVLRRPPTDGELKTINEQSEDLGKWLYDLAAEQLFDDGRRLVMTAMKGTLRPITGAIGRMALS